MTLFYFSVSNAFAVIYDYIYTTFVFKTIFTHAPEICQTLPKGVDVWLVFNPPAL